MLLQEETLLTSSKINAMDLVDTKIATEIVDELETCTVNHGVNAEMSSFP